MRLSDGFSEFNGRLEVCTNEVWGTVCATDFSDDLASVACGALNYSTDGELPALHVVLSTIAQMVNYSTDGE